MHVFCFFLGQSAGRIAYGYGILHVGRLSTLPTSAAIMPALGFVCARLLQHKHVAAVDSRKE